MLVCSCLAIQAAEQYNIATKVASITNSIDTSILSSYQINHINNSAVRTILQKSDDNIEIFIPFMDDTLNVVLQKTDLWYGDLQVITSSGDTLQPHGSVSYHGSVRGYMKSLAAITFADNFIYGVISVPSGNIVVGKLGHPNQVTDTIIVYNDKNLKVQNPFVCGVGDSLENTAGAQLKSKGGGDIVLNTATTCNSIGIYFECQHGLYSALGGTVNNTLNYIAGMFNVVQAIYKGEDIHTFVSKIFIWDTHDNYSTPTLQSLPEFKNLRNPPPDNFGYRGRLGHLLGNAEEGGRAYIGQGQDLCLYYSTTQYAVSNVFGFFKNLPEYSWDVFVISHEMGHNLGYRHTHWCGWNGGPIDNCNTFWRSIPNENGPCNDGPSPINGGTIMSYCHGAPFGINLLNGFGPQPGATIRNYVSSNGACLVLDHERYFQNLTQNGFTQLKYDAARIIYAGKNVTSGTQGPYIVNYNSPTNFGHVTFRAGREVLLKDGFHAKAGAYFRASIDQTINCSVANSTLIDHRNNASSNDISATESSRFEVDSSLPISVYPTPAGDAVTIGYNLPDGGQPSELYVIDPLGNRVAVLPLDAASGARRQRGFHYVAPFGRNVLCCDENSNGRDFRADDYCTINTNRAAYPQADGAVLHPKQQATTEGVAIGEMQKILLRKIEEITLQMIAVGKENVSLKQNIQSLHQQLNERK